MSGLVLGRRLDAATLQPEEGTLELEVDALTRHAVCFGATGSGKTGLCVVLLEELVRRGVPVIAVDPKGDLANLAFLFRRTEASALEPWLEDPAQAPAVAERWRDGLAASGIGADELARVADAIDLSILTPGSRSGQPVDVLGALSDPPADLEDEDGLADAVRAAVRALLELVGVKADPIRDPRHVVLSRVLEEAWRAGDRPGLHDVVVRLVDPPFAKVGAFPVDTFLPRKERLDLAVALNGLLASPSFAAWSEGVPLDPEALLRAPEGKVPVRVVYLAHLDEAERQLAAGLLLARLAGWARRLPGTQRLRAVLLFDEAWGYLPPHPHDPPTKRPLLQLLKQARAVGLGVVLATQNPVDLDYKALSNAGTWLVGRLATPQDRDRVLDGAAPEVAGWLDQLPKRGFWVRRPGSAPDALLGTRWAMTWLRGPMTLREIERVAKPAPAAVPAPPPSVAPAQVSPPVSSLPATFLDDAVARSPRLAGLVGDRAAPRGHDGPIGYEPGVLARLRVRFDERGYESERDELRLVFGGRVLEPALEPGDLLRHPSAPARFAPVDHDLSDSGLKSLGRAVIDDVLHGETDRVFRHRDTRLVSHAGETRDAFRERVRAALLDEADAEIRKLRDKVEAAVDRLEKKRSKVVADLERSRVEARAKLANEVVNAGETLFGLLFGGRKKSLTTAASKREQSLKAGAKADRLEREVRDLEHEIYDAGLELESEIEAIRRRHLGTLEDLDEREIELERDDIEIVGFELVWIPVTDPV